MLRRMLYAMLVVALVAACHASAQVSASASEDSFAMALRQDARVRAPELEGGRGWLNTDKPLSIAALRGKVVVLDFWTYGCVNCMHIIPDLKRLEAKYANQLVVIGVHSAKFENEKDTENIRHIILRYGLEHPVVNDADFRIWQAYAVNAWPTLVLIDTDGYIVGEAAGEGHYDALDRAITKLVEDARKRGTLNEQPLKLALERAKVGDLPLAFPGKILADENRDRLFISDSNHNRIVVTRLDGTLLDTIGTGEHGAKDGAFDTATFNRPQGLALDGDSLYVADTENHLIRRVDLKARSVQTVAGTGAQSLDMGVRGGPARSTPLSSPWDLQLGGRTLYIAMAGPHQIWKLDLSTQQLSVFAGTGREARGDGTRDEAAFAQPSGLATDGKTLYVADAESNTIRAVSLGDAVRAASNESEVNSKTGEVKMQTASLSSPADEVQTLVGGDLFEFGDRDGAGDDVRLQHPLGLALSGGQLFIADTYNHKIKVLDPRARTVRTFAGTGKPGQSDGTQPSFYEPGGLTVARGHLYVADTNNHAVRVVDIATKQTTTLVIRGLEPPKTNSGAAVASPDGDAAGPNANEIKVAPQRLAAGWDVKFVVDVALPNGYHVNPTAPQRCAVEVTDGKTHLSLSGLFTKEWKGADPPVVSSVTLKDVGLPLRIPMRAMTPGTSELRVRLTLYYCREDNTGTCRIKTFKWDVPIEVTAAPDAPHEIKLQGKVE
ncbi:MAG TPA: thioredoxin-like domain-containing protein [Pyrinomonadaceae bacterium]|nr:thioredoxin-like domain-containing protein [Pyrinomonadaceae bacterium]